MPSAPRSAIIPSQGFGNGNNTGYVIPEATVSCEDGKLTVELNRRAFPRVTLQNFISDEDKKHPLSDETLRCMFTKLGLNISRRTIAKYRGELNIPSTSQRRKR